MQNAITSKYEQKQPSDVFTIWLVEIIG